MTNISDELLPCPFCGGAKLEVLDDRVYCLTPECEAWGPCMSGGLTDAMDRAANVEAWNRRTSPPPSGEAGEPVAWRVKDFADGWVLTSSKNEAEHQSREMSGALIQPLYALPTIKEPTDE